MKWLDWLMKKPKKGYRHKGKMARNPSRAKQINATVKRGPIRLENRSDPEKWRRFEAWRRVQDNG